MDKLKGSMDTLSAMQITEDTRGLDAECKTILYKKEVLAVILQGVITEYKGYSRQEVLEFIEDDSITRTMEVSPGRTNTETRGSNTEFIHLNEKTSNFDLAFQAKNPLLSTEDIQINLHINIEPQKKYKTKYPIEKRGIYYLARRLSSQLSLVLEKTDYAPLEKCYSIWICRDDIPSEDCYSISVYEIVNTKNTSANTVAKESYDLMTLVVIKLGNEVYNGDKEDEGYELLRFLNAILYPHKQNFMSVISDYIDFSENEELWKEVTGVSSWFDVVYEGTKDDAKKAVMVEVEEEKRLAREEIEEEKRLAREEIEEEKKLAREEIEEEKRLAREGAEKEKRLARKEAEEEKRLAREEIEEEKRLAREGAEKEKRLAREEGIQAVVIDNLEEQIPKERIILKLQKHFKLSEEESEQYYNKFTVRTF